MGQLDLAAAEWRWGDDADHRLYCLSMYARCLFCNSSLGRNHVLEFMPQGRRVAFDLQRGRLWAVCPACGKWNLCPFEERWEVLEDCARLSMTALIQESTGEISLLRHRSGLSLIRVGGPSLGELVSWRFARNLLRRRRNFLIGMATATVVPLVAVWGAAVGGGVASALYSSLVFRHVHQETRKPVIDLATGAGTPLQITASAARALCYATGQSDGTVLRVRTQNAGFQEVRDGDAMVLLARALPLINETGGSTDSALSAAESITDAGGTEGYLASVAADGALHRRSVLGKPSSPRYRVGAIYKFPVAIRLGLEAATHMDQEDRALSGEIEGIMAEWRHAEAIAEISDGLIEPAGWGDFKRRHDPMSDGGE